MEARTKAEADTALKAVLRSLGGFLPKNFKKLL